MNVRKRTKLKSKLLKPNGRIELPACVGRWIEGVDSGQLEWYVSFFYFHNFNCAKGGD